MWKTYAWLHAGYEGVSLAYQLRYLFLAGHHFSPLLHLIGQTIRRVTMQEVRATVPL